jgi:spoIIIJ-associated protein
MTFREFTGKNVEEAIRAAMREFSADLGDLDIEILSQGARGILGVGGEEARILAAPKSAVAAAETLRAPAAPADQAEAGEPPAEEPAAAPDASAAAEPAAAEPAPAEEGDAASEQTAELARAEERRRRRGGRGRGGRGGRGDGRTEDQRSGRAPRDVSAPRDDRPAREPAPFVPAKPLEELSEKERAVVDEAKAVLEELLRLMEVDASVEVAMGAETAKLNVRGDDLGILIGRRGEKLASLQHIVNLIVAKREGQSNRIAVDVENYRGRREEQLRDVADRAAKRVIQTGKIIQLEPMPALERRVVHLALRDSKKVRTQSVGVEPNRRVVILPASQQGS